MNNHIVSVFFVAAIVFVIVIASTASSNGTLANTYKGFRYSSHQRQITLSIQMPPQISIPLQQL